MLTVETEYQRVEPAGGGFMENRCVKAEMSVLVWGGTRCRDGSKRGRGRNRLERLGGRRLREWRWAPGAGNFEQ